MEKMKKIWLNLKNWDAKNNPSSLLHLFLRLFAVIFILIYMAYVIFSGNESIIFKCLVFVFILMFSIIINVSGILDLFLEKLNWFWFNLKIFITLVSALLGVLLGLFILRETRTTIELKDNLLLALISAPVAFVLWSYRDKNEHDKIENQRFDTNLKYFEQIQERLKDIQPLDVEKQNSQSELHLKISAILQLADFIQGRYGENLKRPAFYLLTSLWEIYVRPSYENLKDRTEYDKILKDDRIIQVLNVSLIKGLTGKYSKKATFLGFENDLDNLFLVGLNEGLVPNTICIFQRKGRDLSFDFHTKLH